MFDLKMVAVSGVYRCNRARVLWDSGLLRVFVAEANDIGLAYEEFSAQPVRVKGTLRTWAAETVAGPLLLKGRCWTCGGPKWWKLMGMKAETLWEH